MYACICVYIICIHTHTPSTYAYMCVYNIYREREIHIHTYIYIYIYRRIQSRAAGTLQGDDVRSISGISMYSGMSMRSRCPAKTNCYFSMFASTLSGQTVRHARMKKKA